MVKKTTKRYVKFKRLFADITGTGSPVDGIAQITIDRDCEVVAISVDAHSDLSADGDNYQCEISKMPAYQMATNGAVGIMVAIKNIIDFTTSGAAYGGINMVFHFPVPQIMYAGEKLYLNAEVTNTRHVFFGAIIHCAEFDAPVRR